jgi:DNA-binding transcriptional LysR family regulator
VQIVLADYEPPAWPVSLIYAAQGRLPIKLRAFLDFAAPRRAQLAGG